MTITIFIVVLLDFLNKNKFRKKEKKLLFFQNMSLRKLTLSEIHVLASNIDEYRLAIKSDEATSPSV